MGRLKKSIMEVDMKQFKNLVKITFIIIALIFTTSASAGGQLKLNFSIQLHGNGVNFGNGNYDNHYGHYHRNSYGRKYYCNINHNNYWNKPKPKPKHYLKLRNKKALIRHMRKLGYRHLHRIARKGKNYVLRAISPRGHKVWLKIDRRNGKIRKRKVLVWNIYK